MVFFNTCVLQEEKIDPKIESLISVLWENDFCTFRSCEGHNDDDWRAHFPWIAFWGDSQVDRIREVIKSYNENRISEERWEVSFTGTIIAEKAIYWLKPKHDYKNLNYLHNQIKKLTSYLEGCRF